VGEGLNEGWKEESFAARQADRDDWLMDMILRRVMVRVFWGSGMGMSISVIMARWSEMVRSEPER